MTWPTDPAIAPPIAATNTIGGSGDWNHDAPTFQSGVADAVKGTAVLDFGNGSTEASVVVTGQTGIAADSSVEAWVELASSADHTVDEHRLEEIDISAGNIVAGTGFTIYGVCRKGAAHGEFNVNWVWAA